MNSNSPATMTYSSINSTTPNSHYQRWYLQTYNINFSVSSVYKDSGGHTLVPVKTFNATGRQLSYINSYGSASNLEQICRNEYVRNTINLYYTTDGGNFEFEVVPWTSYSSEITFE